MGWEERNGGAVGEWPVHIGQGEADGAGRDAVHRDAAEGVAVRADVAAVLEQLDREHDVVCRDRLAVVPRGVLADVKGPDAPIALGVKRRREVGDDRPGLVVARQPAEREA